ncbi:MAG: hypothetical protein WCP35_12420 [Verrucomicrobiota bacterium]
MIRIVLLPLFLCFVSCATQPSADTSTSPAAAKSMSQRFNGPPVKQGANGQWPDDVKKFSAYDSDRQSVHFTEASTLTKSYKTTAYAKPEYSGETKEVPSKTYSGNTDGKRFNTPSRIQHDGAHESGTAAAVHDDYQTGDFSTSPAQEDGGKRFGKPSNAQVDARRGVYPEPEVNSWKQQRALDMKTTKSILGHDGTQD